jgi:hypothetical protein
MHCDPVITDACFIDGTADSSTVKITRHYRCVRPDDSHRAACPKVGACHVCQPIEFPVVVSSHKNTDTFDLCSKFSRLLSPSDKLVLERISGWLSAMDTEIHTIWKKETERRTMDEERDIPLASMAIIIINQCAVNLTEKIVNLPEEFPMRTLFVSTCIGWTVFWKNAFQGSSLNIRYRLYIL